MADPTDPHGFTPSDGGSKVNKVPKQKRKEVTKESKETPRNTVDPPRGHHKMGSRRGPKVPRGEGGKWLPGFCPNPHGRPKRYKSYAETVRAMLEADYIDVSLDIEGEETKVFRTKTNIDNYHVLGAAMVMEAFKGNVPAAKELIERIEGKAMQAISVPESLKIKLDGVK